MNLKYRKKPIMIEAFQMTKERRVSNADWPSWLHEAWMRDRETPGSLYPTEEGTSDGTLSIDTLEGKRLVSWDDWIIRGLREELYFCKDEIFRMTYEPATGNDTEPETCPVCRGTGIAWRVAQKGGA